MYLWLRHQNQTLIRFLRLYYASGKSHGFQHVFFLLCLFSSGKHKKKWRGCMSWIGSKIICKTSDQCISVYVISLDYVFIFFSLLVRELLLRTQAEFQHNFLLVLSVQDLTNDSNLMAWSNESAWGCALPYLPKL